MTEAEPPSGGGTWEGFGPGAWGPLGGDPAGSGMSGPGGSEPGLAGAGGGEPGAGPGPALSGQLLVAAPGIVDPNFARTVVLVLHHDIGGSLGLVLNRPSQLDLEEPLAQWGDLAAPPKVVFVGGPVSSAVAICMARLREKPSGAAGGAGSGDDGSGGGESGGGESGGGGSGGGGSGGGESGDDGETGTAGLEQLAFDRPQGWRRVWGRIGTLDLNGDPAAAAQSVDTIRVFAGYAGWGPGQLPAEIGLGGWLVVGQAEDDVFWPDPKGLWKAVLRRQPGEVAILASYPEDLSAN